MVFIANAFGGWLVGQLATAGRQQLSTWLLGSEQERALRQAATAAIEATAQQVRPAPATAHDHDANYLAQVIDQVFRKAPTPAESLAEHTTLLEGLQAGVAARLAVLADPHLTGTGRSSAELLGVSVPTLTDLLTNRLLREILVRGAGSGPLAPLANQLNHDVTHLQGQRQTASLARLTEDLQATMAALRQLGQRAELMPAGPKLPIGLWNIPTPVPSFLGRDRELAALHDNLRSDRPAALLPTQALHGMAGIGKSQLARAYAHQHRNEYRLGWWIVAEDPVTTATGLAELALRLGADSELPQSRLLEYVGEQLAKGEGWLLIFDNAIRPAQLEPYLPAAGAGHVIITSRNPAWRGLADPIGVDLFTVDEAVDLLCRRTGDDDQQAARVLAVELGRLPLAVEQAAAYASQQQVSLVEYLELFRSRRAALLARGEPLAYGGTVAAAFALAIDQLSAANLAAVRLLEMCALLSPDRILVRELMTRPDLLPSPLAEAAADPVLAGEVLGALYQAGLLTRDVDDTAWIHRLVQDVMLGQLADTDLYARVAQTVAVLSALAAYDPWEPARWPAYALLLPHAQAASKHADSQQLATRPYGRLLAQTATYVRKRGLGNALARDMNEHALKIERQVNKGKDHRNIAVALTNLAGDLRALGEPAHALALDEEALAMDQRMHQGDHPDIGIDLTNLANDLHLLGDYERAREFDEQALAMRRRLYEGDHREVAQSLSNLADDLRQLGDYERARELDEQALAIFQRIHPGDHPNTAEAFSNLGKDLRHFGDYQRAREFDEQALAIRQQLY